MPALTSQDEIVEEFGRQFPGGAVASQALLAILRVVPVPNWESLLPLAESLNRLSRRLPWVSKLSDQEWPSHTVVAQLLTFRKHADRFHTATHPQLTGIKDRYAVYSAVVDRRAIPPLATEQLRAILIFCASRWAPDSSRSGAIGTMASAARGLAKGQGLLSEELKRLGEPASVERLAIDAAGLNLESHQGLKEIWWDLVVPELGRAVRPRQPEERPANSDESHGGAGGPGGRRKKKAKRRARRTTPRILRCRQTAVLGTKHERAEAPADRVGEQVLGDVPTRQKHLGGLRRDLHQAKQTIWSGNHLLLTERIESLRRNEATILGRSLGAELDRLLQAGAIKEAGAVSRLVLSLATGRGARALACLGKGDAIDPARDFAWSLCLQQGILKQSVLRPDQAFAPDAQESTWLECTRGDMVLVPCPALIALLRRADAAGISLWAKDVRKIESELREACRHMAEVTGLRLTPGRVRRTLACLLQDDGRDLAATMLISGDTHGLSSAPLYYYAARESDLQQLYGRVSADVFGGDPSRAIADPGRRVGSRLLIDTRRRVEFSRSLGSALQGQRTRKPSQDSAVATHNAVANHVVGMLLEAAGHRPVDALFQLTRWNIDLDGSCAVFQDKQVDAAHETRIAALPTVLRDQLVDYLGHLRAVKAHLPKTASTRIEAALAGRAPLLFQLELDGSPRELTIGEWLAQAPAAWRALPPNHGRTTIATRGRDHGASPEALAIQLGHLEAVGFPFSVDGPTEPILLAAELAPALDRLAREGGWKVRSGYVPADDEDMWPALGPLPNWQPRIDAIEARQKAMAREAMQAQRAQLRSHRLQGEAWVLEALVDRPVMVHALETGTLPDDGSQLEHLGPDEVVALQETLQARAAGDAVATLAAMNALRRLLLRLKETFHWIGYVPFAWRSFHRQETTPFFPGMMLARAHIEALRAHFASIPTQAPEGVDSWDWQCARAALALCLFGFVDDPGEVIGILQHARDVRRCSSLPDLLLVPWRETPRAVAGLRGLAAIAIAAHAKASRREDQAVDADRVDLALRRMLPTGASAEGASALQRLCSMVSVANRVEISGAARTALSDVASAALDRQLAWLDGDPVLPLQEASGQGNGAQESVVTKRPVGDSRRQYRALVRLFPGRNDTRLPRTGKVIASTQAQTSTSRKALIAEVEAVVNDGRSNAVVAALACWARKMLAEGTLAESAPAYSTVKTYLTTVGADLVAITESSSLADLDEAELTQMYLDIVEMKGPKRRALAAREVLHFHHTVAVEFGLVEIDESELAIYLGRSDSKVDTELVLPQEWECAVNDVRRLARDGGEELAQTSDQRRLLRQATALLDIVGAAGARTGEPLGMRLSEMRLAGSQIFAALVPNRHRRIKTRAGWRVLDLTHRLGERAADDLRNWVRAEKERLPDRARHNGYLFAMLDAQRDVSPKSQVRQLAAMVLGKVTGRSTERLHRGRHMVASSGLAWFSLMPMDRERVAFLKPLSPDGAERTGVQFPRDLHRHTATLGHRRPVTSIRVYLHFNWMLRARSDAWIRQRANRHTAAVAMGVSVFRADQLRQKNKENESLAWLDGGIPPRVILEAISATQLKTPRPSLDLRQLTPVEVGRLLGWAERGVNADAAALSAGITAEQQRLLQQAVDEYAAQIGRDFRSRGKGVSRRMSGAVHLYQLWEMAAPEDETAGQLTAIARALFASSRPTHGDTLVLPQREASLLKNLLVTCGHGRELIVEAPHTSNPLRSLRIRRVGNSSRYIGLELKRLLGVIWIRGRLRELMSSEA